MPKSFKLLTNIRGKRVLVRVDLNIPIKRGRIIDTTRIKAATETILSLKKKGAKVIVLSHFGDDGLSLAPVSKALMEYVPHVFVKAVTGPKVTKALSEQKNGEVILLENVRTEIGEKENDLHFAKTLASYADIYVNEAFPASHRKHASIVSVSKYLPSYMGIQFEKEIKHLSYVFDAKHPVLAIVGGAKFKTKLPLIKACMNQADTIFVAGALMNTLFVQKGYEVGTSLVDTGVSVSSIVKSKKVVLPEDVVVAKGKKVAFRAPYNVAKDEMIVDVGPQSLAQLEVLVAQAKTIIWNGPLGKYDEGFGGATEELLKLLAKSTARVIIGGGDTIPLITKLGLEKAFYFVSTGGGATLEFLSQKTLPGIKALK